MTFRLNGTTINELKLNGTTIEKAYLNGTKVYEAFGTHELTVGNIGDQYGFYDGEFGSLSPTTAGSFEITYLCSNTYDDFYVRFTTNFTTSDTINIEFENGLTSNITGYGPVTVYDLSRSDIAAYLAGQSGNTIPIEITIT